MLYPTYEPPTVPTGSYKAEIAGEMTQKPSQYKEGGVFLSMPLRLTAKDGSTSDFNWAFNNKHPMYKLILLILGANERPDRKIDPPPILIGRKFVAQIIERPAKNDRTKLVNDVVMVSPFIEPKPGPDKPPYPDAEEPPF